MIKYSTPQIVNLIIEKYPNKKLTILSPIVKGRKGHYKDLFNQILKQGFLKARIDGEITSLSSGMVLDRYKTHDIEVVIDQIKVKKEDSKRISNSVETALKQGKGTVMIYDNDDDTYSLLSRNLMCPTTGLSYDDPAPNLFSFNSPYK